jgi:dolichyl-diphosphooligosaccharide--protein glycosyltransferase
MMYGVSALKQCGNITGAPFLANATSFTPAAVQYIDPTTGAIVPQPITPPSPLPYYQPVKVFASVYYAWSPAGSGVTYFYSVVVFLYRWTGVV